MSTFHDVSREVSDYSALLDIRGTLFPEFVDHQNGAVEAIVDIVLGHLADEKVACILDVGCGTGEMLREIEQRLRSDKKYGDKLPKLIGVDSCQRAITEARTGNHTCRFEQFSAEDLLDIEKRLDLGSMAWDKTLVMAVGHSLPHFEWSAFLTFLIEKQPRFLLIDFYKNWNYAIEHLSHLPPDEAVEEPRQMTGDGSSYLLYTQSSGPEHVQRGIRLRTKTAYTHEQDLFTTRQFARKTEWFLSELRGKDYVLEKTLEYTAGYGEMHGYFLARTSTLAYQINQDYYAVVAPIVAATFRKPSIDAAMGLLRTRVAAVVMPFDHHFPFARYVAIEPAAENVVPDDRMLIADANTSQSKYPTAHGLFMALLDRVSSAAIVPLPDLKGARSTDVDRIFKRKKEDEFFKASSREQRQGSSENTADGDDDVVYFVAPFYFGDLPLFCLITNFGSGLPVRTTDQNVYASVLQNVARLVQQELHDGLIEDKILWPFVQACFSYLCGDQNGLSTQDAINRLNQLFADARNLPWKSWLVTVPSTPIARLAIIQKQKELLETMWNRCVEKAAADMIVRVSDWFRSGNFFDIANDGHNLYNPDVHPDRLKKLLACANINRIEELPNAPYLRGTCAGGTPEPELEWVANRIEVLLDPGASSTDKEKSFQSLKAVFCREQANHGSKYRYSLGRLIMLMTMYIPDLPDEQIRIGKHTLRTYPLVADTRYSIRNDQTMAVMALMKCFQAAMIESLSFTDSIEVDPAYVRNEVTIDIKLKEGHQPVAHRGGEFEKLSKAVRGLDPDFVIGPFSQLQVKFRLRAPVEMHLAKKSDSLNTTFGPMEWIVEGNRIASLGTS